MRQHMSPSGYSSSSLCLKCSPSPTDSAPCEGPSGPDPSLTYAELKHLQSDLWILAWASTPLSLYGNALPHFWDLRPLRALIWVSGFFFYPLEILSSHLENDLLLYLLAGYQFQIQGPAPSLVMGSLSSWQLPFMPSSLFSSMTSPAPHTHQCCFTPVGPASVHGTHPRKICLQGDATMSPCAAPNVVFEQLVLTRKSESLVEERSWAAPPLTYLPHVHPLLSKAF